MIGKLGSALVVVSVVALAGCAADAAEDSDESTGAQVAAQQPSLPTLENFLNHSSILPVREVVESVESQQLTPRQKKDLCKGIAIGEASRETGADASGKTRRLIIERRLKNNGTSTTTYYYDGNGKLRFAFETQAEAGRASENRAYFDGTGKRIFDAFRSAAKASEVKAAKYDKPPTPLDTDPATDPLKLFDSAPRCN